MSLATWNCESLTPEIPSGFLQNELMIKTDCWRERERNWRLNEIKRAPMWQVRELRLSRPILIQLGWEDGMVFAKNDSLRICGVGETEEEALLDFSQHFSYFYNYYTSIARDSLIGDALRLKDLYTEIIP